MRKSQLDILKCRHISFRLLLTCKTNYVISLEKRMKLAAEKLPIFLLVFPIQSEQRNKYMLILVLVAFFNHQLFLYILFIYYLSVRVSNMYCQAKLSTFAVGFVTLLHSLL